MTKHLTRSNNKMISGVAAGVADYVNIDPVIVRLIMALLILGNLPLGLVVYIILAIIMPEAGEDPVKASANPFSEEEIVVRDV